jgi:hypothetical protein
LRATRVSAKSGVGLLHDRALTVVGAHGGYCGDIPPGQPDFLSARYIRDYRDQLGRIPSAEGLSRGLEAVAQALDRANTWIDNAFRA